MGTGYFLYQALDELGQVLVKELKNTVPVNTGELRDSIGYEINKNVLVFTYEEYGQYVNDGTKPHWVPINAIRTWAEQKGLNPYAVQQNIRKYGTRANNWLEPLEDFERDYFKKFDEATYQALEELVWEKISKYRK